MFVLYTQLTNVAAGLIIQHGGPRVGEPCHMSFCSYNNTSGKEHALFLENFIKGWLLHCEERSLLFETCENYHIETFPCLQQIVSHLNTSSLAH